MDLTRLPDSLESEGLWAMVGSVEHERLDFGVSASKDLQKVFAAMAMTEGGRVLLGINDDRVLRGCPLDQAALDTIRRASAAVDVDVDVHAVNVEGVSIIEILVPAVRDRVVTTADGRLLRRVGSDSVPLVGVAVGRFVRDRVGPAAEDVVIRGAAWSDIDVAAVNEVLRQRGRPAVRQAGIVRALRDLHVLAQDQDAVTRAVLVLFARDPAAFERGQRVQLVHRSGTRGAPGSVAHREEMSGPLAELAQRVMGWVDARTATAEVVIRAHRERLARFPVTAVREAVLNALAHRDLSLTGATVDILLWDDALEIRSPGGLPGHVTKANIKMEHFSRNARIMSTLAALKLVEEFGEGVDRMYRAMEERLLPEPILDVTDTSVVVTLLDKSPLELEDQVWLSMLAPLDLTPAERHALALTRRSGHLARRDLASARPHENAGDVLAGLVTKGLLLRHGERGGSRYSLSAEVVSRAGSGGLQERQRQRERLETHIRQVGGVSSPEAAAFLGEPLEVARELLRDLVRVGRVKQVGRTRATRYLPA